jgi:phenylalanyl-tRNA synthetase beta chain
MVEFASLRAAYLLEKYADAKVVEGSIDVFDENYTQLEVSCRPEVISQLLGVIIPHEKIVKYFRRLGFSIIEDNAQKITVEVPPYRHDIHREADLVEEVARIHGLKDIPARYVKAEAVPPGKEDRFGPEEETRAALMGLGLTETMTVSLISEKEALQQTDISSHDLIRVSNPLSLEYEILRPSLLPGLLQTVRHNIAHGCPNLAFFEVGNVHCSLKGHATQTLQAGIAMTGAVHPERFGEDASITYDFYDLKGVIEGWLEHFGIVSYTCEAIDAPMFLAGNAAAFKNSNCEIVRFGQISPELTKSMRIEHPLFIALIDIAQARQAAKPQGLCKPLPQFPTTHRDISMVAPKSLHHEQIMQTINRIKPKYIESVQLFDVYEDEEQLGADNRSLAYSLVFRHPERTLNDKEVNKMHEKLKEELGKKLPISFR